jgi:prepilin-type N-terminal cleavage/methylation domain-containing protein
VQRGFSLIETVVATSLLAGALVALAQFMGISLRSGAAARAHTATTLMAEQKMEQIRAMPWAAVAAIPAQVEYLDAQGAEPCPGASMPCGDAAYVRRWRVTRAAFSSAVLIIDVDVRTIGGGHGNTTLVTARTPLGQP